jgi:hypothetical protein
LGPIARAATADIDGEAGAYPYSVLEEIRVISKSVGSVPINVMWAPGTSSALDAPAIAER